MTSDLTVTLSNSPLNDDNYEILGCYNNIKKGNSAHIVLRGKGQYAGVKAVKFKIRTMSLEHAWQEYIMSLKNAYAW